VAQIRQRERENTIKRNDEAAAAYREDVELSPEQGVRVVRVLAQTVPLAQWQRLAAFCREHSVPRAIHDAIHEAVFGDTQIGCDDVNAIIVDTLDLFSNPPGAPPGPGPEAPSLGRGEAISQNVDWFLQHHEDPTAHEDAHAAFPGMTCAQIKQGILFAQAARAGAVILRQVLGTAAGQN